MLDTLRIGKNGNMPTIGYGTYQMTNEEVENFFFEALIMGYRHVDTAEAYGNEMGGGDIKLTESDSDNANNGISFR